MQTFQFLHYSSTNRLSQPSSINNLIYLIIYAVGKQIEKLVTQLFKSYRMLFKIKDYTNISVLIAVYFALSHSYLSYSKI